MKIQVNTNNIDFFKCLSSKTRIKIIELLANESKNIGELANKLGVSSAIITRHIDQLRQSGIIETENKPGKRGLQKICSLSAREITLLFNKKVNTKSSHTVSIPVGQYSNYDIQPTCGLASPENLIGICDDPRHFSNPERFNAGIIWFQTGWVEYCIPGYLISTNPLQRIQISLELCSEFPGYKEDWPSDIHFYLNHKLLGVWQSPGDFGDKEGIYNPNWWNRGTEHGLLKTINITKKGTMIDGIKLSDTTLKQIAPEPGQDMTLRIEVPEDTENPGGVTLFGKGFGNYDQNIEIRIS